MPPDRFRTTLFRCGLAALCLLTAASATAQESATVVLRSGNRISGELVDLGGVGFTIRVNGAARRIEPDRVAIVEFTDTTPAVRERLRENTHHAQLVLRNGEIIEARLYDIAGTTPLRITVDTPSGQRDFTSTDVAQIHYPNSLPPPDVAKGPEPEPPLQPWDGSTIAVSASQPWTPTGMHVLEGQFLWFSARGEIQLSTNIDDVARPAGALNPRSAEHAPIPESLAGAFIGRVGSATFGIGDQSYALRMPATGLLMLGVNDDHHADNAGEFLVTITKASGPISW